MIRAKDIIDELNIIAPPYLAEPGDKIGLQVGNLNTPIKAVGIAVDPSISIIEKALEMGINMIITHHPLIYRPLDALIDEDIVGKRVAKLIRAEATLFVLHTNYDIAPGGINDVLADLLGIDETIPLIPTKKESIFKISVFTPAEALEKVRNSMASAGAGRIGEYSHCSFRTSGIGTFIPSDKASPYLGLTGHLEEVSEYKLEMVCAEFCLNEVIEAMIESHPYEEVAYDVYELVNKSETYGLGRVGDLKEEIAFSEFANKVKDILGLSFMRVCGASERRIKRVALCGGSGSSFFKDASSKGADVYITGDVRHHDIIDADSLGLAMIDAGHFLTERPGVIALLDRLRTNSRLKGLETHYIE